jgi:Zn-dependent peptidase ImmA (M78 family)
MKKKFPKQLTILGRKVKIKQGVNLVYNGTPCLGLCNYDEKVIYLEKNQSEEMKKDTLCHEAAHFFLELTGISQKLSDSENEIHCQLITAFFHDIKGEL